MPFKSIIFIGFFSFASVALSFTVQKRDILFASNDDNNIIYPCPNLCGCSSSTNCSDCELCLRQLGEPCSENYPCDTKNGLFCKFKHGDNEGVCRESSGVPCIVYNKTYEHGKTFKIDCRTQCACQNGTYGCSSLCPQEHISPRECQHPRLVEISGQCCRQWMCDSRTVAEQPPACTPSFTKWSNCTRNECGSGLSTRKSNLNEKCTENTETRICQIRRCQDKDYMISHRKYHHLRKGHECKATHRLSEAVFLRFGPCRSRKRFRPKYCGLCLIPGINCEPTLSTTVNVDFICEGSGSEENIFDLLPDYLEPGADLWAEEFPPTYDSDDSRLISILVQWILKCRCIQQNEENINNNSTKISRTEFNQQQENESNNNSNNNKEVLLLHRVHRT